LEWADLLEAEVAKREAEIQAEMAAPSLAVP